MFMCLVEPLYLTVSCPFNRVVTLGECVWALISALQEVLFGISLSQISSCVRKPALLLYSHSFLTVKIQPDLPVDSRLTLIEFLKIEIHNSPAIHSPFKVKNSMAFNAFTGLYNHHHQLVPEHIHCPKRSPLPISSHSSCPLFLNPLATESRF